ncbi:MAG: DUF6477 family protein [Boseongicola sp.]|nr:DUF6477 family protein [Boseongicola sp.]
MQNPQTLLSNLRRPGLLVRAAKHGLLDYKRERTLTRILGTSRKQPSEETVERLLEVEAAMEENRRNGDAAYSAARHVEYLVALLAEVRLLAARLA